MTQGVPMRVNYAIIFVSDMNRAIAFYRDVFGLSLRFESPGWTEFATDAATLALHATTYPRSDGVNAEVEFAGRCRPGLSVTDLDAFHKRTVERQVPCLQEPRLIFGARVAQYSDPDGLVISVGEERRGN
jgi:catechol 2,3-dioxygenase-like lactoylglutathione lyase family enzyme